MIAELADSRLSPGESRVGQTPTTKENGARACTGKNAVFAFVRGRAMRRATLMLGAVASLTVVPWTAAGQGVAPVVRIREGWLRGTSSEGVDRFLGVPFAAPPVGERRWAPPAPPTAWSGIRSAEALPPRCAQGGTEGPGDEDCLYLNVYRPAHPRHAGRLPVLFYIHGGALAVGSSIDNDPSGIASSTDTIVVMINYRLGPLGFLAHPALNADSEQGGSGEYGLMDQQAALRWVHERISAFGGDPFQVTIAGFSAGAYSVCAHLVSPAVAGLFSAAVVQSGACWAGPRADAESSGVEYATALGCAETNVMACLRKKSAAELLAVDSHFGLVWGGRLLPEDPAVAVPAGRFARVPVMVGMSHEEGRIAVSNLYPLTQEAYASVVTDAFGDQAQTVLDAYPVGTTYPEPFDALSALASDSGIAMGFGGCLTRRLGLDFAKYVPTFLYEFDDPNAPPPTWASLGPGEKLGSSHGSDEGYWFDRPLDTLEPLNQSQRWLAYEMRQYLGSFVEHESPRVPWAPWWPRFEGQREQVMRFRPGAVAVFGDFASVHQCEFWASLGL